MPGGGTGSPAAGGTRYASVAEIKQWLVDNIGNVDPVHDDDLARVLDAASRQIDDDTGRRFYTLANIAVDRYCDRVGRVNFVDLIRGSTTTVEYDGNDDDAVDTVLDVAHYRLMPKSEGGLPAVRYQWMEAVPSSSSVAFTPYTLFRITSTWGYLEDGAVPPDIAQACLLLSGRLFQRRVAVFGRAVIPEVGTTETLPKDDPDYRKLLMRFIHRDQSWWTV